MILTVLEVVRADVEKLSHNAPLPRSAHDSKGIPKTSGKQGLVLSKTDLLKIKGDRGIRKDQLTSTMSEYWVSQAKKHCDFCKCWIADNRPSRDFHERGKRHQDNVKKKIEEVRKSSVIKAQKDEEMNDSLREMNENAMKALKKDLMADPSLASQYGIKLKPKEPEKLPEYGPAPRPESSAADEDDSDSDSEDVSDTEEKPETPATVTSTEGTWHMAASDAGYPYYWNDITSEVSWVPPPAYLAQQAGQGTSQEEPQGHSRTPSPEPPVKKKKKRSKELEEPVAMKPKTEKQRSEEPEEPEEPVAKKPKTEKPEPVVVADIPLPCNIPLPPPPDAENEVEDDKTEGKEEEEESNESDEDATEAKPHRPKSNAVYGTWKQIEEEPRMEDIDLGLPEVKEEPVVTIPVAEPKLKFREKTVSSLGSGPVFFKKPKKKMTAAQFLKKREES